MLLTITSTSEPATDLGFLLHKNPARFQSFELTFGKAHVFYPAAEPDRCTAALLLDVDPVGLSRGKGQGMPVTLEPYVNDRPYVASSFLSVAIASVFGTALAGNCKPRPELVEQLLPLQAHLAALPCRGGEDLLRRLFEPLGYTLQARRHPLDPKFPEWGDSRIFSVDITGVVRLKDLLSHLYVLIPVLDDEKHYWVGDDEVEKLLRHGSRWLPGHPEKELIANRYLKHRRSLAETAIARLVEEEPSDPDEATERKDEEEAAVEKRISLHEQRIGTVLGVLRSSGARRVLDLGCGEGRLLRALLQDKMFESILGLDVSARVLEIARDRLRLDRLPTPQQNRIQLIQGSLMYRDARLAGYDAAAVVEVIEHLDPPRLAAFERVLFEFAQPGLVVVTTPNGEYNVKFETLPAGKFRHRDHRFEWTREQFKEWANRVGQQWDYSPQFLPIGPEDPLVGPPSQMAVFRRIG